jgi:uncharacterized protein (TIGR03000 family)
MFRVGSVLAVLTSFAALAPGAHAQQSLPASPGVMPGSPWGPGMPVPAAPITQRPGTASTAYFPVALPWGWGLGWGYSTYNPWVGYGYAYGGIVPPVVAVPEPVFVAPPQPPQPAIELSGEYPATLSLQFPAAAEVWLNGKKLSGAAAEERVLTSPALLPNEKYTFDVKARWASGGKTYETTRAVVVGAGDRSRLLVVSGVAVK